MSSAFSSFSATRKAITLVPTSRTLSSGVPVARGLNLGASAGSESHGHHDGGARTDFSVPKWAGRNDLGTAGVASRTRVNGELDLGFGDSGDRDWVVGVRRGCRSAGGLGAGRGGS